MDKLTVANFFKNARTAVVRHSPQILTGIGIVGMIGTTVMAVQATPKAVALLEEKKEAEHKHQLTPVEVVKTTWKCYIPAAVTGAASVACLVKANSVSMRRNAALVTAYNLSKTALTEYKEKVIETIGEKKEKVVRDQIAKDKLENHPVRDNEIVMTERGSTLCHDGLLGRYFMSDRDAIQKAVNAINRSIVTNMYVSLNEFYDELGLSHVDIGDMLGWNFDDGEIEIDFHSGIATDGRPCLVISYNVAPRYEYSRLF